MSELAKRVVVALVAAPIVIVAAWFGDAPLAALISGMAGVAAWECFRLARARGLAPHERVGIALAAALPLLAHATRLGLARPQLAWFALAALGCLALTVPQWVRSSDARPLANAATTFLVPIYTGGMLSFGYDLRYHPYAIGDLARCLVLVFPLWLAWSSDTGAYFAGRLIGGPKLIPAVSPGKTVAGAVGGVVLSVVMAFAFVRLLLVPHAQLGLTPLGIVVFGIGISLVAQTGDLVESLLKREAGVKDSSSLLPGHGGLLDRIDSVLYVLPVAVVLYDLLLVPAPQG